LDGAPGIDPDIFFDDDGKVWYVGTHSPDNPNFEGEGENWLHELDLHNWKLTEERYDLWRGACGGMWVEGPHIYKREGYYYLMVAEGGTSFDHAVMITMSEHITGPYRSNPRNPILTSRHLSYDHWVNSTGHGDLVELPDGKWFMVVLGIRGEEGRHSNMGRETHLVPVTWEREPYDWLQIKREWPVCAPFSGRVERINPVPITNTHQRRNDAFRDNFESPTLNLEWNFRRLPLPGSYSLSARSGRLRLFALPQVIRERGRCSLMGIRQKHSDFEYTASMEFSPETEMAEAGLSLVQRDDHYLNYTLIRQNGDIVLRLTHTERLSGSKTVKEEVINDYIGEIILRVSSKNHRYQYEYSLDNGKSYQPFTETESDLILSRGYTGAYLGIYATGNGRHTNEYADFSWIHYKGYPRVFSPQP
jgi:alpha-N-arabinofuranosidase